MKRIVALAVWTPLLVAQTGSGPLLTVSAVRHWTLGDVTRVAVELSGSYQFRTDRLHDPERVYFDILNSRPRIGERRIFSEALDDARLKRIRVAETMPGVSRVVLDLADAVDVSTSQLTNPYRLIIELRTGSASPPEITASPQPELPAVIKPPAAVTPPEQITAEPSKNQISSARPAVSTPAATPVPPPPVAAAAPPEVGKAARRTAAGESSLIRTLGLKVGRVVIDPGHGGHDQGTEGPHGLLEKDLVLDVAKRLGKLVEERMGAEVIFTRSDDTFVPLEGRTALANEKKADLFLSIHANSSAAPKIAGIETFYLNITGSKDALDVAARENASSQKSVFELADLIQKIAKHDKAEESREFAGRIQTALYAFSARNVPGSKNRGVKTAPFVVLIGANMPSVLAEIGFLSNPREEALLKKPEYRQKLADALYRGLARYADSLSHFQMASAPPSAAGR